MNASQNLGKLYGNRQGIFGCPESDSENERQFQTHFEILIWTWWSVYISMLPNVRQKQFC